MKRAFDNLSMSVSSEGGFGFVFGVCKVLPVPWLEMTALRGAPTGGLKEFDLNFLGAEFIHKFENLFIVVMKLVTITKLSIEYSFVVKERHIEEPR